MQLSNVVINSVQAMSIKFNTMVYELQRSGKKVIVMSLGEAFFNVPLLPFDTLPNSSINHYSNSRGLSELRQKLSEFFLRKYDISVNYEKEILITSGSKAAIHFAFMSVLNPGDEVLIHEPYWVSYPEQIKLCYGVPVCIPHTNSVFEFEKYINSRTRVIVITNPNNPTGYVYSEAEIKYLLALAEKNKLWLFSDEVYSEFIGEDLFNSPAKFDREKKHTVLFNSISKNCGISGWRLGYVIANENLVNNILKINQHLITCPATILEYYVDKYFYDILKITEPQIKELMQKRREIAGYIKGIGLQTLKGSATFYFFVSIEPSKLSSEEFCTKLLHEYYISVVPGIGYGKSCDKFIRISIGTASVDDIKKGLLIIKNLIDETSTSLVNKTTDVLIVAGGIWQVPIINFIKNKGHKVFVVDPYLHSPGVPLADKHIACDVRDFETIKSHIGNHQFRFIASDQTDVSVNTIAQLNTLLGLNGNPIEVTDKFVNKYQMRILAASLKIPIPSFAKIERISELHSFIKKAGLPVILKPADSQSSRGVVKIDRENIQHSEHFFVNSLKFANCGYLIAEEFIEGKELTVEGFASNYKHRTLAISLKQHFRTGIASELKYPAEIPENIYNEVERLNDIFVENSGLRFGITHAEYIINMKTGRIALIEIACRGGGTLISSDIINWVTGVNVYELYYNNLLGSAVDVKELAVLKRNAILKFFEFPVGKVKKIYGINEVRKIKEIKNIELFIKPGDNLIPADDDRSRHGYYIAYAESKEKLDDVITRVQNKINVEYE
jgi:aspartate/methionine/tyrosine aminotransferase/biotin carboxylase